MSSFSFLINYFTIYFEKNKKQNNFTERKIVLFFMMLISEK